MPQFPKNKPMSIRMYNIYVYVCMYMSIYICMCICMYVCIYACMRVSFLAQLMKAFNIATSFYNYIYMALRKMNYEFWPCVAMTSAPGRHSAPGQWPQPLDSSLHGMASANASHHGHGGLSGKNQWPQPFISGWPLPPLCHLFAAIGRSRAIYIHAQVNRFKNAIKPTNSCGCIICWNKPPKAPATFFLPKLISKCISNWCNVSQNVSSLSRD